MVRLETTNREFYNVVTNGPDFDTGSTTPNLVGNVMERVMVKLEVQLSWFSEATGFNEWTILATSTADVYTIRTEGVTNFTEDGWAVGNVFNLIEGGSIIATGEVRFISDDGTLMRVFTITDITGTYSSAVLRAPANEPNNQLTGIRYFPNIIPNDASFTDVFFTGEVSEYFVPVGVNQVATPIGTGTFNTGEVKVSKITDADVYTQAYEIEHEFIITPYFLDGFEELDLPSRYAFVFQGFTAISDPNSIKEGSNVASLGSVGNFNQSVTRLPSVYSAWANPVWNQSPLSVDSVSLLNFNVNKPSSVAAADIAYNVLFSILPSDTVYSNTEFNEAWRYDSAYGTIATGGFGNDIIDEVSASVLGDVISFGVTFNAALNLDAGAQYYIALTIGDSSLNAGESDRTTLLILQDELVTLSLNNDLITLDEIKIIDYHGSVNPSSLWPEDGFYIDADFSLDTNKSAILESLTYQLVAYNTITNTFFPLEGRKELAIDTRVVDGVQLLDSQEGLGYLMQSNSIFNTKTIEYLNSDAGFNTYNMKLANKVNWLERVFNPAVPDSFFNADEPNNNQNFLTSQYSTALYEIRVRVVARVRGLDGLQLGAGSGTPRITLQTYVFYDNGTVVFKYDEDGEEPPQVVAEILTLSLDGVQNFGGNIRTDEDTLFRVKWILAEKTAATLGSTVIHRIEESTQTGTTIHELTNSLPEINTAGNLLKPLAGTTGVNIYATPEGDVISECLISRDRVDAGVAYNLSAKLTKI